MSCNDWKEAKLGEVCEIIGGGTPKTTIEEYWNGTIPWLSVVDFNNDNRRVFTTEKYITEQGINNSSTKILNCDDIIISARGTVGAIAQLGVPMAFNQSCYGMRAKKNIVSDFMYYATKNIVKEIKNNTHGSVFDTITRETFNQLYISLPTPPEQKAIADTLSCLDDKIELNNKINKNLEAQVQAIFKSWFVDFEPFQDGEFVDSELGRIPKGWRVGTLGEVAEIFAGGDKPKKCSQTYTEQYNIPIYSNGTTDEGLYGFTNEAKIFDESITVSARGTIGFVCLRSHPYVPIVRLISVIPQKELLSAKYLYLYLNNINISGTGSTQQQLTIPAFKITKIIIPNIDIINRFTNIVEGLFIKIETNKKQTQALTALRDTLLPKLMSGEIRVPVEVE